MTPKAQQLKKKCIRYYKPYNFFALKDNFKKVKKTSHRMGEKMCKSYSRQATCMQNIQSLRPYHPEHARSRQNIERTLTNLIIETEITLFEKQAKDLNR